jgi:hypothetical protein
MCSVFLGACQLQPDMQQLQDRNNRLDKELAMAQDEIVRLQDREASLSADLQELQRVAGIMEGEKSERVRESLELRGQVRRFVQQQIDALRGFLVQNELLDYVGGELVDRAGVDDSPLFIVDLANAVPRSGTLTGVAINAIRPAGFRVKVLRPAGDNLVVIWQSTILYVEQAGISRVNFPVTVGVEEGDVIAYYFAEGVAVSYDEGTGDARFQKADVAPGAILRTSSLQGEKQRRAYSVGVYGLLN